MRFRGTVLFVLSSAAILAVAYVAKQRFSSEPQPAAPPAVSELSKENAAFVSDRKPVPVAANRGPEVLDGFRGEVHPLLSGATRLEVTAHWTPVGTGRDELHRAVQPIVYSWFKELSPTRVRQIYTERDFSAFLPEKVGEVGQMWALDLDKMAGILKQFHPRPSMHLVASGRRAGPDGAFALLRAESPSHLDIVFRLHAEFYLTPDDYPAYAPLTRAWYTPAYFSGRVLVNRQTGTVDHFRLALATEKALNVHLTVDYEDLSVYKQARDVVRVERMELVGGDGGLADQTAWTKELAASEAAQRLAKVFYKFLDIDWTPLEQALARARSESKPIFAVVSWGAFEDQSC